MSVLTALAITLSVLLLIAAPFFALAGFAQAYVYGALGGLVGTLAAGMLADRVLPFVYNIGLTGFRASMLAWLFLGGLVSIEQMVRRQGESKA